MLNDEIMEVAWLVLMVSAGVHFSKTSMRDRAGNVDIYFIRVQRNTSTS